MSKTLTPTKKAGSLPVCPHCARSLQRTEAGALACFYAKEHPGGDLFYTVCLGVFSWLLYKDVRRARRKP